MFHTCVKIKQDISYFSSMFVTSQCLCYLKLSRKNAFCMGCDDGLKNVNLLLSMVLQIMCEANSCLCLEHMHSIFDNMFRFMQSLLIVLSDCEIYWQYGMVTTLDTNNELMVYLEACANGSVEYMIQLCKIMQVCDHGHSAILSRFNMCDVCIE